ncbi:carbohydrate ABC transporter permease [Salinibacterium sp. SWN1162]|uniref:carbohydrate ABC transporter permease n=1 Tax=Salinibacterium sp. SWN1162 TaxID=2792053 RepID=UPI0018CE4D80|nr:sugar ABC transporter permease [Salinibacterium sp. SWN1162]MBH0009610.1 sugar ABC transporter permease [Salinibacterium sp. SWN1162]
MVATTNAARTEVPRPTARKRSRPKPVFAIVALAPFIIFGAIFAAYPLGQVIRMALSDVQIRGGIFEWTWIGFANFGAVLTDANGLRSLGNTVIFVAATVVLSLIVGLALALLVDRAITLLPLARNVLIWPAVIAPVVVSLMWLLLLSPTAGGLNKALYSLGLPIQGWIGQESTAMAAVIVVDVWHWTPVVFLFLYTALKSIDGATLEAARVDGANEWRIIQHVVLPALRPAIAAVVVVRVIMGVKAFDEMYLLTSGGPNFATTLVTQHIKTLFFDSLQFGEASAFSLVVVILTALVLGAVLFTRSKVEK